MHDTVGQWALSQDQVYQEGVIYTHTRTPPRLPPVLCSVIAAPWT